MNTCAASDAPPAYLDVVHAYSLDVLRGGADFVLTLSGGLATTKDGDLKLGSDKFNAMFRFVHRWRLNEPTLRRLFEAVKSAPDRNRQLVEALNAKATGLATSAIRSDVMHGLSDARSVVRLGRDAYAGTIVLVLNHLLRRFEDDVQAAPGKWESVGPLVKGRSVGTIVQAAGNNFRHFEEWAATNPPTPKQLSSIQVIADVLGERIAANGAGHPFRINVCAEILDVFAGTWEEVGRKVFAFAKALA